ncbi:MAG: hypothetical protein EB059_03000 [Alphaproteobacteria bacterium]|nr:hypothetical protein [Alphaproteobacteria bacterium]
MRAFSFFFFMSFFFFWCFFFTFFTMRFRTRWRYRMERIAVDKIATHFLKTQPHHHNGDKNENRHACARCDARQCF